MTRCLWGALVSLALVSSSPPAGAQAPALCAERRAIAEKLAGDYAETPVAMGLAAGGLIVEVFASPSGSFTILVTRPAGPSCIVAAGEGWESLPAHGPGRPIRFHPL